MSLELQPETSKVSSIPTWEEGDHKLTVKEMQYGRTTRICATCGNHYERITGTIHRFHPTLKIHFPRKRKDMTSAVINTKSFSPGSPNSENITLPNEAVTYREETMNMLIVTQFHCRNKIHKGN